MDFIRFFIDEDEQNRVRSLNALSSRVQGDAATVQIAETISAAAEKTTPVDADTLPLVDSEDSGALKKITWANIKATLKTYFDSVAQTLSNKTISLTSNTLTGTTAEFNTALTDNDFATLAGIETLTNKTLTSPVINTGTVGTSLNPVSNDGAALGSATISWSDIFLASGAVINYANGNVVLTHSSGILTASTGDLRVTTAGTNAASVVTVGGTQTLTNKSISLGSNTLSGTIAQFNTALSGADFATLAGSETITNKIIDGVTITSASASVNITGASVNIGVPTPISNIFVGEVSIDGESIVIDTSVSGVSPIFEVIGPSPETVLHNTSGAANNRRWRTNVSGDALQFQIQNDAETVSTPWLQVDRTGTTVDTINFSNGTLQQAGVNVVTISGSQTLTNKTIDLASNTLTGTTAQFNTALSDGNFATLAGSETLTNKTISLTSNTLSGTTAQFNTALSDGDFATIAGSETLTNKTLTNPTINAGSGAIVLPQTATPAQTAEGSIVWDTDDLLTVGTGAGRKTMCDTDSAQTLTNKTVNLTSNTLTGTTAQFNTAISDGNFATQAGSETLTNKTIDLASNTLTGTEAQFNAALSDANFITSSTFNLPVHETPQTASASASLDFTGIPSWVRKITVMFDGLSLSGTDHVHIQLGDSGGFETNGYVSTSMTIANGGTGDVEVSVGGFIIRAGVAADVIQGSYILTLLNSSTNTWAGQGCHFRDGADRAGCSSGTKSLSGTLTQLRFIPTGANNIDAGTVNIRYEY